MTGIIQLSTVMKFFPFKPCFTILSPAKVFEKLSLNESDRKRCKVTREDKIFSLKKKARQLIK